MKSYRNFFQEKYIGVKVPAQNKKGYKIQYQYSGLWYCWELCGKRPWEPAVMGGMACLNLAVYLVCGISAVRVNYFWWVQLLALLSSIPLLFELVGVVEFFFVRKRATEYAFDELSILLHAVPVVHGGLLLAAVVLGVVGLLKIGFSVRSLAVLLGYFLCAMLSFGVRKVYQSIPFHTEKSKRDAAQD